MSITAPVTVAWQRVTDNTLPDTQSDRRKRIETFSQLSSGVRRARDVVQQARNPNDDDYTGQNAVAHITVHPGDYEYEDVLDGSRELDRVYITLLPGGFTTPDTLDVEQESRENIADLNKLGGTLFFEEDGNTITFDANVDIKGDLSIDGDVLNFDLQDNVEGGIQVRDVDQSGNVQSFSQLLYNINEDQWTIGDDTRVEGTLSAQNLDIDGGLSNQLLPSGVQAGAVTYVSDQREIVGDSSVFSFDPTTNTLSTQTLALAQGTSVSEIKTSLSGSSENALVTESALSEGRVDVLEDNNVVLTSVDEIVFTDSGDSTVTVSENAVTQRSVTVDVSSQTLNPDNFVNVSGDTMEGKLIIDDVIQFTSGQTNFNIDRIVSTVSGPMNARNDALVTESGIRDAINSKFSDVGVDIFNSGIQVESDIAGINFTDNINATKPSGNPVEVSVDSSNFLDSSSIKAGTAIEVSESSGDVTIGFSGQINQATFSGDGSKRVFEISHGQATVPQAWLVQPATDDASSLSHVSANSTTLQAVYDTPPPSGTDNIVLNWFIRK